MITTIQGQTIWTFEEPTLEQITSGDYTLPVNFKVVDTNTSTYKLISFVADSQNGARRLELGSGNVNLQFTFSDDGTLGNGFNLPLEEVKNLSFSGIDFEYEVDENENVLLIKLNENKQQDNIPRVVNLTLSDLGMTPSNTEEEINQALADYINGLNLTIGEKELYFFQVEGFADSSSGGNYIPLTGTEQGKPVNGTVFFTISDEMDDNPNISSRSEDYELTNNILFSDGLFMNTIRDNGESSTFQIQRNGVVVGGYTNENTFNGISSTQDFSEITPDNKLIYAQRSYADNTHDYSIDELQVGRFIYINSNGDKVSKPKYRKVYISNTLGFLDLSDLNIHHRCDLKQFVTNGVEAFANPLYNTVIIPALFETQSAGMAISQIRELKIGAFWDVESNGISKQAILTTKTYNFDTNNIDVVDTNLEDFTFQILIEYTKTTDSETLID